MRLILSSIVLLVCLAVMSAPAQPVPRVGVLELTGENLSVGDVRGLTDRLRMAIHATGRYVVLERERMDAILQEQGFQQTGCTVSECAIEIGQLLGVEKMVAGSINRIDAITTINVRLLDVATGAIERTALKGLPLLALGRAHEHPAGACGEAGRHRAQHAGASHAPRAAVGCAGADRWPARRLEADPAALRRGGHPCRPCGPFGLPERDSKCESRSGRDGDGRPLHAAEEPGGRLPPLAVPPRLGTGLQRPARRR